LHPFVISQSQVTCDMVVVKLPGQLETEETDWAERAGPCPLVHYIASFPVGLPILGLRP